MDIDIEIIKTKITKWLKEAFELYKENFVLILICTTITMALGLISALILAGPLAVGLFLILSRLIDKSEPVPTIQDLFKGFDSFLPSLLFVIASFLINYLGSSITAAIPGIGGLLNFLFSAIFTASIIFGIPLIADKKLDFIEAFKQSFETVKPDIALYIAFSIVLSIISFSGFFLFVVGIFFTVPFNACAIAVAYKDIFGGSKNGVSETKEKTTNVVDSNEEE